MQMSQQGHLAARLAGQLRIVAAHPALAGRLGCVHGGIGIAQQGFHIQPFFGGQTQADAGRYADIVAGDALLPTHRLHQLLSHLAGLLAIAHVQQGDEFIAAPACQHLVGAQHLAQLPHQGAEQLVTGGMAQGVVDLLEAIDIDEQHREVAGLLQVLQARLEILVEGGPVGQLGQGIAQGHALQGLLGALALGDVPQAGDHIAFAIRLAGKATQADLHRRDAFGGDVELGFAQGIAVALERADGRLGQLDVVGQVLTADTALRTEHQGAQGIIGFDDLTTLGQHGHGVATEGEGRGDEVQRAFGTLPGAAFDFEPAPYGVQLGRWRVGAYQVRHRIRSARRAARSRLAFLRKADIQVSL